MNTITLQGTELVIPRADWSDENLYSALDNWNAVYDRSPVIGSAIGRILTSDWRAFLARGTAREWRGVAVADDPYTSLDGMIADLLARGRFDVWSGAADHPGLGQSANLNFRWHHDYYGHALGSLVYGLDTSFTIRGEVNALHCQLAHTAPEYRPLVCWEILGQLRLDGTFPTQKTCNL